MEQTIIKYFYVEGSHTYGPYTLDELRGKNIARDTKVWFQELGDWKPAGSIPELNDLFKLVPPPISAYKNPNYTTMNEFNSPRPPKTWLVESILVTLFCCLPFGIAGIVNAAKVESRFYAGDIAGADRSSAEAKKWTTISFFIGISGAIIYLIALIAGVASNI